jgi:predicted nucleotidyltransferase
MVEGIIFSTNCQKILSFLIHNADKEYYDREISKLAGVSRAGTNVALRTLSAENLISRKKQGRMYFYKASSEDIFIKQLKILQNITKLMPLTEKLKEITSKIVLFGSSAKGENTEESDIDIFILTRETAEVGKIIFKDQRRQKIKPVIKTINEFVKEKQKSPVFYKEIEEGIVLWEKK